ncbi:MAG: aminoglycoside phosphotransferase [Nitrospira sp. CG24B]|nr:MAG: aminoglycoside phosphotransferase [Nitrospira sp. CG24B]
MLSANTPPFKTPLSPPDQTLIAQAVETRLSPGLVLKALTPLAGDASNRRYYRATVSGGPPHAVIVMQLAEPEGFKQSEEAVSGGIHQISELPFINIMSHLAKAKVPVPVLHYYDQSSGLLYLEDFGDVTLAEAVSQADAPNVESRYKQAINILVQMQVNATTPADPGCLAFHRSFDVPLLMWEFDHFLEYGIVARRGNPLPEEDATTIRREFEGIAELLAGQPRVFTHRDYHSRNLMVDGLRLGVIDFQDALMGPATYDLASLLRDAYIRLDEALVDDLVGYYLDQLAEQRFVWTNRAAFRRLFDLTSIQRNLKAAGRFVYIDRVKANSKFLADIPRVLSYVKRNLEKHPELDTLRRHLTPYVPELQ